MERSKLLMIETFVVCLVIMAATPAGAASYDLTTDTYPAADGSVTINGAIWSMLPSADPTGSGVFNAFFRVQADGMERGYNTDGRKLQFDEKTSPTFTHSALLADVPLIEFPEGSGHWYREFQLDINEKASNPEWYISLDEFQVWLTNDPDLLGYDEGTRSFTSGADLAYDLGVGNWIMMDYRTNPGSGKRDIRVLVPGEDFDGAHTYVVIFTRHGAQGGIWVCDSGYEEWGVAVYPLEPDTLAHIDASAPLVYAGQTVDLTVSEQNTGNAPLTNVSVTVNDGSSDIATLDETDASWSDNGGNGDAVLDPLETWSWTISGVIVNAATTFTATGYGEDPGGNPVTWPDFANEQDTVDVDTISPDTQVGISASASTVYAGDMVDLTLSESNTGDDPLTNVSVTVNDGSSDIATLDETDASWSDNGGNGDAVLDPGETWSWTISGVTINTSTTFTATGDGTDSLGNSVTYPGHSGEQDTANVEAISPGTQVGIDSSSYLVNAGETVDLTVTETNTGDDPLDNVLVTVDDGSLDIAALDETDATWSDNGGNGDAVLDPGETWSWMISGVTINAPTTFTATGYGEDSKGNPVTIPDFPAEQDSVTVDMQLIQEVQCYDATAFGFINENVSTCFLDLGFNNWGWTNGPLSNGGEHEFELWAGAAQCDMSNGFKVGTVTVKYTGSGANITYNIEPGYEITAEHVYIGRDPLPGNGSKSTVSPGQYYIQPNLNGDIYIIYHAVIEWCDEG